MNCLVEVGVCRNPNHYASWGSNDGKPHWPKNCSCCGAEIVIGMPGKGAGFSALYACGAVYRLKPQCQNHTDVYWGSCPETKN